MKMRERRLNHWGGGIVVMLLALFMAANTGFAQNHDLVMTPAADFTSATPADKKSPDLKIGADFGGPAAPDIVRRGIPNEIFARFLVNGMQDHTLPSGTAKIKFYWRHAAGSTDIPPLITDPTGGWNDIGEIPVTYIPADGPFTVTRVWPTNFPSVTNRSVSWTPPETGDYFHVAAEAVYTAGIIDANPGDNVAISLYESRTGLLDIVLLHDVSGSMGYYNYGGFSYMQHSIARASAFLALVNPLHRISVVSFSSRFTGGSEDSWPGAAPQLRPAIAGNVLNANTAIAGLTASGATPMGEGIERAIQILTTAPGPTRKRIILMLSDGYENTGTPRACNGGDPLNPCVGGGILGQLQANNIRVFSVALGTSAWTECLKCLATESMGHWYTSLTPGLALAQAYLDMQQEYTGDDLYRVDYGTTGGNNDTFSTYFEGKDDLLYFALEWEDLNTELELKLRGPRSRRRPRMNVFKGKGYYVVRVQKPARGTWRYTVSGPAGKAYLAAVRSNRVGARLEMSAETPGVVGGPIHIQAFIGIGKEPITNSKITASVKIPIGPSLNTKIRDTYRAHVLKYKTSPVSPIVLKRNPDISARGAFTAKLRGDSRKPLVRTREVQVTMHRIGRGHYEGVLKENYTTTSGEYTVTVKSSGRTHDRVYSKQVMMRPAEIDYKKTFGEVMVMKTLRTKSVHLLRVYPTDRFGNAIMHPSFKDRIQTNVKNADKFRKAKFSFGAFQRTLSVKAGKTPILERIRIDGRQVKVRVRRTQ